MNPSTFSYGPWLPDISNQGLPAAFGLTLGMVPAVDCLNVAYANGNYYCVPSPVPAGPTLGSQIFSAYTWYDNSGGKEIVFAGLSGGISALIDGAWQTLPFFNSQSVQAVPWQAITTWGSFINARPWVATTTLGTIGTTYVPNVSARVDGGRFHQPGTGGGAHTFILNVTVVGGTATAWAWSLDNGVTIFSTAQNPMLSVQMNTTKTVYCTVTVNGNAVVATPGDYTVFNDA